MGLLDLFGKKKKDHVTQGKKTNSLGEDLDHLDKDGELPWGWIYANKEFVEQIESEYQYFINAWYDSKEIGVLKEYAALKSFVLYLNDAQRLCFEKGECFAKWFSDIIANQEYIDKRTVDLLILEDSLDEKLRKKKGE